MAKKHNCKHSVSLSFPSVSNAFIGFPSFFLARGRSRQAFREIINSQVKEMPTRQAMPSMYKLNILEQSSKDNQTTEKEHTKERTESKHIVEQHTMQ